MKYLFFTIGLLCFNVLSAQDTLKLSVTNAEPRIGEKIQLSFSFEFFSDDLKSQLNDGIEMTSSMHVYGMQNDKFTRSLEFTKTGKHTIGPFTFDFNGKTIVTDSIVVNVAEKLPFKEGVWIRLISDQEGNKFLIVEQQIQNKSDVSKSKNGFSQTVGGKLDDKAEFVEIMDVSEPTIKISFRLGNVNTRMNDEDMLAPGFTYSLKKYVVTLDEDYDGDFTLTKKHLKNLPKKTPFTEIEITN